MNREITGPLALGVAHAAGIPLKLEAETEVRGKTAHVTVTMSTAVPVRVYYSGRGFVVICGGGERMAS